EGDSLKYTQLKPRKSIKYVYLDMEIEELFTNQSPKAQRVYTLSYKVTLHAGKERREELKLAFSKNVWGTFTEAWYNGVRMKEASTVGLDGAEPVTGFDGAAPVAVMLPDTDLAYLIIPVE
ncbi:MAG: hypothetical protein LBF62_10970, partial [Tannerellaceae bacterium]|nr:hypothetical protein [Tannerellaceae bacterium]